MKKKRYDQLKFSVTRYCGRKDFELIIKLFIDIEGKMQNSSSL